jgi:hypothetical protein
LRAVGGPYSLWDVDNVEAHVHATLDAALLANNGSWLSREQYQRAFTFLLWKCWELSGLKAGYSQPGVDGEGLRYVWEVRGFIAPRGPLEQYTPIKLPQFPTEAGAETALALLAELHTLAFESVAKVRPRGAYDPAKSAWSFCTYSRKILTKRLADWYRSDEDFGDSRYKKSRRVDEESIEALAARHQRARDHEEGDFLERRGPGSRLEVVDELNRHAYADGIEAVLMRVTEAAQGRETEQVWEVARAAAGC